LAIDQWVAAASLSSGHVFRPLNNRHQLMGDTLLSQNIMEAVLKYGQRIGVPHLPRTISAALSLNSPTKGAPSSNKFSSAWDMPRSSPPNAIWASGRIYTTRIHLV
jgi:hypothetical protein